ncbi:phenylacetic acid degradation operon negative regulatory protein PaaX [Janthinobacterium sp. SUN137]|uniref:phenylacetic acid degradation operon negative regulatory protein PaaX n=1 Tax=Janthinobacterium sp. SUN137 TaxID=3014789 RepID=UPI002713F7EC|nr:phenylacetic acid degradation operon negative regulatory protein PaaX [Janthinobacterium sp. SUN137]MDO8038659.1 phenylacetic acid degradation operon negative regulatory protein PaaX [Janthinobacterium sp. SUN137]
MKNTRCTAWIADFLESDPPRSKSLVMTIFGDAIVPRGGAIWLGSLIELLAPFGVNDRLLRTSVFRLAQEGWLSSQRDGRRSAYTIRPEALARFERAYRRIYAPLVVHWDGSWTLVIGPAGSIGATERGALRKELLWAGYGLISPGIFGHPASNTEALEDILVRNEVQGKLYVCHTTELPGVSTRPLRDMVGDCWDLSEVIAGYQKFIASFQPLLTLLQEAPVFDAEQAFVIRSLLTHAYRRVQLHDPQLPVELLPEPWPGTQAYALARDLYRITYAAAEEHILATLRREDAQAPDVEPWFYERFGGLNT